MNHETGPVPAAYRRGVDFRVLGPVEAFDGDRRLVYRGQFDDTRPTRIESGVYDSDANPTGADLRRAIEALLKNKPVPPLPPPKPPAPAPARAPLSAHRRSARGR